LSRIERWLAPGILVGIALFQIILTFAVDLTPWKGGGFGMFSTIDGPDMRLIWCEGTTLDGESILIDAPLAVSEDEESGMQAIPKQRALFKLGHMLMGMEFVPDTAGDRAVATKLREENPEVDFGFGMGDDLSQGFYRPMRSSDPEDDSIVELDSVRLRWWKVVYDSENNLIRTEPLGEQIEMVRAVEEEE